MESASCSTLDMLSNLPENLLENIFSHLSMRDVVRTSVLSTKWRYKWVSVPYLIFNDECIPVSASYLKFVEIVNHILLLHRGPVQRLEISRSKLRICSDIDRWILYLSLNSIKEFKLKISIVQRHKVPPCLFSSGQLSDLTLVRCIIVPPAWFNGFSCLRSLFLEQVKLSNATLECLVSTCLQLESLTLIYLDGPTHIELCNPKLKYLWIKGKFICICLKDLRNLVFAKFYASNAAHPDQQRTCNFTKVLGSLLNVQELVMQCWFLQSLAIGDVPRSLPSTYDHLNRIAFEINVVDMKEILVAMCLLKSSPNLRKLEIMIRHDKKSAIIPVMDLQEAKEQLECTFNRLWVVNFFEFSGNEMELELIKFILANSPVLETMNITPKINDINKVSTLLKELIRFKRASPQVEIVYLDPKLNPFKTLHPTPTPSPSPSPSPSFFFQV